MRQIILGTVLIVMNACSEPLALLDGREVLRATVEQTILPNLETLKRTAEDLHSNSSLFCANPTAGRLQPVIFSWKGGKSTLKSIELLNFGPYTYLEIDVAKRLDNWPERGEAIEETILGDQVIDSSYIHSLSRTTMTNGYPALGYLLNTEPSMQEQADVFGDVRRCAYLLAQSEANLDVVQDFYDAWSPQGEDYASEIIMAGIGSSSFLSPQEAIGSLLMSMNRLVQHMADSKLAQPLDTSREDFVEAKYSGTSLDNLEQNLEAILRLYAHAEPSISDYIVSYNGVEVDTAITNSILEAQSVLGEIPVPLSLAITEHPERVAALIVALEAISQVITHDAEQFTQFATTGY